MWFTIWCYILILNFTIYFYIYIQMGIIMFHSKVKESCIGKLILHLFLLLSSLRWWYAIMILVFTLSLFFPFASIFTLMQNKWNENLNTNLIYFSRRSNVIIMNLCHYGEVQMQAIYISLLKMYEKWSSSKNNNKREEI